MDRPAHSSRRPCRQRRVGRTANRGPCPLASLGGDRRSSRLRISDQPSDWHPARRIGSRGSTGTRSRRGDHPCWRWSCETSLAPTDRSSIPDRSSVRTRTPPPSPRTAPRAGVCAQRCAPYAVACKRGYGGRTHRDERWRLACRAWCALDCAWNVCFGNSSSSGSEPPDRPSRSRPAPFYGSTMVR